MILQNNSRRVVRSSLIYRLILAAAVSISGLKNRNHSFVHTEVFDEQFKIMIYLQRNVTFL